MAGQTGEELGFFLLIKAHWKVLSKAEVGRDYSGAFNPDKELGPKSLAQNSGYGPEHHAGLIPIKRVPSLRGLAVP